MRFATRTGTHEIAFGAAVLGALLALAIALVGREPVLTALGIPVLEPAFADLHNLLGGLECHARGFDVLTTNPCDPFGLPMNYPRVWLALGALPLTRSSAPALGALLGALFLGSVAFAWRALPRGSSPWALALLFSPSVGLLLERANNDIVVIALLVLVSWLVARHRIAVRAIGYAFVLAAAVLKLFPIAAGVLVARERPRVAIAFGSVIVLAFGAYVVATADDFVTIARVLARGPTFSFGLGVAPMLAAAGSRSDPIAAFLPGRWWWLALTVVGGFVVGRIRLPRVVAPAEADAGYLVALGVFVFAFDLTINWDYRLAVLLLAVPRVVYWCADARTRAFGRAHFACMAAAMWCGFFAPGIAIASQRRAVPLHVDLWSHWALLLLGGAGAGTLAYFRSGNAVD